MNNIILFSNGCPRCKILKEKLEASNISFIIEQDLDEIMDEGFQTVPVLKYNGKYYDFNEAVKLVHSGELIK